MAKKITNGKENKTPAEPTDDVPKEKTVTKKPTKKKQEEEQETEEQLESNDHVPAGMSHA